MKKILPAVIAGLLLAAAAPAAPLMETTAIHSRPDAGSPAIGFLKAGTDPVAAANVMAPAGWMAVEVPGNPYEAYVNNNDFNKSLDIRPGAAIRLKPKADAPIFATMHEGDKTEITGLRSGWTRINLYAPVVGYIQTGPAPSAPGASSVPVIGVPAASPAAPAPAAPPVSAGPAADLPRTLQGLMVETKGFALVGYRPPYAYQLSDTEGKRIAYLDVSKVAPLQKMEPYVGRMVTVSGVVKPTNDWDNLVVEVQTLQTK